MPKYVLQDHPDSREAFLEWMEKDFLKRNGGYTPRNIAQWWNRVEKCHVPLREFMKGIRFEHKIKLFSKQNPISTEDAKPYIDQLLTIAPSYLNEYKLTEETFLLPTATKGTHNAYRVSKHFRTYVESLYQHSESRNQVLKQVDEIFSQLGALWAKAKTSEADLHVTISTSPRGFALLGHYGPDKDSCFRQGSDKTQHKYILGQTNNTFVLTVSQLDKAKGKYVNAARCIGFADNRFSVFNLANYYFEPGFNEGDFLGSVKQALEYLCGTEMVLVENKVFLKEIFHNPYGNWLFTAKKNADNVPSQILCGNISNIKVFTCPRCGIDDGHDDGWEEIDGQFVCLGCVRKANKCQITGKKTFAPLVDVFSKNGDMLLACEEAVANYVSCDHCETKCEEVAHVGETKVCKDCLEPYYSECDACEQTISDSELCDIGDRTLCRSCVENGEFPFEDYVSLDEEAIIGVDNE